MFWQRASIALLAGTIVAATSLPAYADDACCTPAYRTVCCTEWVPVKYTTERTVYKVEYKTEKYTGYKCECVPVEKTRTCTYYECVPETKTEWVTVCKRVPCWEEHTVMCKKTVCKPCVKIVRKCVDKGHYESRCVEYSTCLDKLRDWCNRKDCCYHRCPKYKTKKVWVPCPVWVEHKVCSHKKVTVCTPVKVKRCTYKTVTEKKAVKVCCYKRVAKQKTEKYTCYETRKVPCEMTRCVKVCVPVKEKVTCCKMVKKTVVKKIPCEPCCKPCCPKKSKCCW